MPKTLKTHARRTSWRHDPDLTVCGQERIHHRKRPPKISDDWDEVDCGRCHLVRLTAERSA